MTPTLENEFNYYLAHQKELADKYLNKFIVIKNNEVIGYYESELEAYTETIKSNLLGTFLIQLCLPGTQGYSNTFHSRVVF